jgi:hypothetical protein
MIANNVAFVYVTSLYNTYFECYYARFFWGLAQIAFGISQPHSVHHMFVTWINQVGGENEMTVTCRRIGILLGDMD